MSEDILYRSSSCIEKIGPNLYRCKNRGFTFKNLGLPIYCVCDAGKKKSKADELEKMKNSLRNLDEDEEAIESGIAFVESHCTNCTRLEWSGCRQYGNCSNCWIKWREVILSGQCEKYVRANQTEQVDSTPVPIPTVKISKDELDTTLPTMVVVAGPGRSGTSCVAGLLNKLGISMGSRFQKANLKNETGYWEDLSLKRFVQGDLSSPNSYSPNLNIDDRVAWFKKYANRRREGSIVGCKHPALCFFLPEMNAVWPRLKVIATYRDPRAIIESLKLAHWWNFRRISPIEIFNRRDTAIAKLKLPTLIVDYDNLIENAEESVDKIIAFLEIQPSAEQREAAIAHINPNLRHARTITAIPAQDNGLVDVVYPLGKGSRWDDNELRYSLRSLEKFAKNLGRIFVVGQKPHWLINVIHIPLRDCRRLNKDANIIKKILAAIDRGLSEHFIFASDDQYISAPVDLQTLQVTHGQHNFNAPKHKKWWRRMKNTCDYLNANGWPAVHYDTHLFQPHSATEFKKAVLSAPYEIRPGFCINTLVLNQTDKIQSIASGTLRGRQLNGYGDRDLKGGLKKTLAELFPEVSQFEKD